MGIYRTLSKLAGLTGNDKISFMKQHQELKTILDATYNPFKKYNITVPPECAGIQGGTTAFAGSGGGWIENEGWQLLYDLRKRNLTGNAANEAVCDFISTLNTKHARIFKGIINKDLRLGIGVKTINKAFPGLIPLNAVGDAGVDIMLCKTLNKNNVEYPVIAAVKKDGVRCRIKDILLTRNGHKFIGFDHIESETCQYPFQLDGEMCVPGEKFDGASGLIRNAEPVPTAVLWLFDVPSNNGNKLQRLKYMVKNVKETDNIKIIPHKICYNEKELFEFYDQSLADGDEGIVVYTIQHQYRNARSTDWCRLVPTLKAECRVVDFLCGTGKFKSSLGKIVVEFDCGDEIVCVKVGTGFAEKLWSDLTDKQKDSAKRKYGKSDTEYDKLVRDYIWNNKDEFYGCIAQLEYKEKTKTGSMRQPRFKGWRYDKITTNID